MPQLSDGIDIVVVAVAIFALGEALWVAAHLRRKPADVIPVGRPWMGKTRLETLVETMVTRHRLRIPVRGPCPPAEPSCRRFCPTSPRKSSPSTRTSSVKAPSKVWPGPEAANNASAAGTLVTMLSLGLPTSATAAVMLTAFVNVRHPARSDPVREGTAADLDADREPVHRQLPAPRAEPATGPALVQAAAHPAALPLCRHPVLRSAGCLFREPATTRPRAAAGVRPPRTD